MEKANLLLKRKGCGETLDISGLWVGIVKGQGHFISALGHYEWNREILVGNELRPQ